MEATTDLDPKARLLPTGQSRSRLDEKRVAWRKENNFCVLCALLPRDVLYLEYFFSLSIIWRTRMQFKRSTSLSSPSLGVPISVRINFHLIWRNPGSIGTNQKLHRLRQTTYYAGSFVVASFWWFLIQIGAMHLIRFSIEAWAWVVRFLFYQPQVKEEFYSYECHQ